MKFKILLVSLFTLLILSVVTNGFAGNGKGVPSERFLWGPYENLGQTIAVCDGFDVLFDWRGEVGLAFQLVIPGHGSIFKEAGRVIYDFNTGEVLFSAGPHDLGPYWDFDWQSLCEYFTP